MTSSAGTRGGPPTEASIAELAELVRQLPEQMSQLAHDEVELVKAELKSRSSSSRPSSSCSSSSRST